MAGVLFTNVVFSTGSYATGEDKNKAGCDQSLAESAPRKPLYTIENNRYKALTPEETLKKLREDLRYNRTLFESNFRNLSTIYRGMMVGRALEKNIFMFGPPGGAKSALANWVRSMELKELKQFALQLHQMMNEMQLIGGQNLEVAKKGEFEANTKNSIVDSVVALLDEIDKASPAVLAVILSILNEREALLGNKVVKAKTQTIISTSNQTLPEFNDSFVQQGMGSTGPAFLNRFLIKAFVYNWLATTDQAILNKRYKEERRLKRIAQSYPEVLKDKVFLKPREINWEDVRDLANVLFNVSDEFDTAQIEMVERIREDVFKKINESENQHATNPKDEPYIYHPTADWSERLRKDFAPLVEMDAFLDFLESPLSDDQYLAAITAKPVELQPLSLWRGLMMVTSLGPGETKMIIDPSDANDKIKIDFGWTVDIGKARDARTKKMIQNLIDEQKIYADAYRAQIQNIQHHIEIAAQYALPGMPEKIRDQFEILIAKSKETPK